MKKFHIFPVGFPRMLNRAVWLGTLGLTAVCLSGAAYLQAQSIETYVISGITSSVSPTISATSTDPGINSSALSTLSVATGAPTLSTYLWTEWENSAVSPNLAKYMTWDIGPKPGYQIDFSSGSATFSLTWDFRPGGTFHGAQSWELDASIDNFVTAGINLSSTMDISAALPQAQTPETVGLGVLGIVGPGTIVTFRLYGFNEAGGIGTGGYSGLSNNGNPGGGDLIINGAVSAVPELSSYAAVFGALAFGFVFITRRLREA